MVLVPKWCFGALLFCFVKTSIRNIRPTLMTDNMVHFPLFLKVVFTHCGFFTAALFTFKLFFVVLQEAYGQDNKNQKFTRAGRGGSLWGDREGVLWRRGSASQVRVYMANVSVAPCFFYVALYKVKIVVVNIYSCLKNR